MGTLQKYLTSLEKTISNTDIEWRLFVKDHRELILDNAMLIKLNSADSNFYSYRFRDFLVSHNINPELGWIILWLNQLYSEADFHDIVDISIPDLQQINKYYAQYVICRTKLQSIK